MQQVFGVAHLVQELRCDSQLRLVYFVWGNIGGWEWVGDFGEVTLAINDSGLSSGQWCSVEEVAVLFLPVL